MFLSTTLAKKRALRRLPFLALTLAGGCHTHESPPLDSRSDSSGVDTRVMDMTPLTGPTHHMDTALGFLPDEFDPADGITLAEGEVLAMRFNPYLRIGRLKADLELTTRESNGPQDGSSPRVYGDKPLSPWPTPFDFGSIDSLTIPEFSHPDVEDDQAGVLLEMQRRQVVDAEWTIRYLVRKRWSTWSAAVAARELMIELTGELQKIGNLAKKLRNMDELNRVEHRLLKIEMAQYGARTTKIDLRIIEARADLLETMGLPPEAGDLLVPGFPQATIPTFDDLASRLIEHNTTLAVELAAYRLARSSVEHDLARATVETTFERLFQILMARKMTFDLTSKQLDDHRAIVIPLLSDQQNEIRRIAQLGEIDVSILLKTAIRRIDAMQELIDLEAQKTDAAISIEEILGPDSVGFTPPVDNDDNQDDSDTLETGSTVDGAGQ